MASFVLNGAAVEVGNDHNHLLAALRDELGIISPKDGCAPSGQCGCCTVLIDGKARVACQTDMAKAEGAAVTTLEGVDPSELETMAAHFAAHGALQCGFCTPGIVMRAKALIDKKGSALTRDEASRHLGAHLCRCTGYIKILDAVEDIAAGETPVAIQPKGVGTRGIKYEAADLAVGRRPFIDDMTPAGATCTERSISRGPRPRRRGLDRHGPRGRAATGCGSGLDRGRRARSELRDGDHPQGLARCSSPIGGSNLLSRRCDCRS